MQQLKYHTEMSRKGKHVLWKNEDVQKVPNNEKHGGEQCGIGKLIHGKMLMFGEINHNNCGT